MTARLLLYGRSDCHLCDEMIQALEGLRDSLGFSFQIVNIDADPELEARHGKWVPLLADAAGREICHYFLDIDLLRVHLAVK